MLRLFSRGQGRSEAPIPDEPVEPSVGIDIPKAIEAHVSWKLRLQGYIAGSLGERLDAVVVGADDCCVLGKWLHGPGMARYGDHATFQEVKTIHAAFHRCAGEVVRAVDEGRREEAQAILNQGEFPKYSTQIKSKLASLCLELES